MVEVTKLNLGQYSESRFGQDFNIILNQDSEIVICSRFVNCDLVLLAMFLIQAV